MYVFCTHSHSAAAAVLGGKVFLLLDSVERRKQFRCTGLETVYITF